MKMPLKILLLEDNPDDADMIKHVLKKEKWDCIYTVIMTAEGLIEALEEFKPDLILSDNAMPQFSATEALAIVNQRTVHIPFILVTGTVSEEFAANIIKEGADDYILKDRLARLPAAISSAILKRKTLIEKKAAEEKVMHSETNLRAIFENTSEGFLLVDREGVIKTFNQKAAEYSFFSKENNFQIAQSVYEFIEESRKPVFRDFFSRVLNNETIHYERRYEADNGDISWLDFSISPVWEDGIISGACISGRDITQRKKAETEIRDSYLEKLALAERMSTILNTLPANIALLDANGIIVDVNQAWRNFANENGFIGANYSIADNYLSIASAEAENEISNGQAASEGIMQVLQKQIKEFTLDYQCHSPGEKRWFRMIVSPLQEQEGAGVVVMHINITEQKKGEEALQASLKDLSDYKIALDESSIVSITDPKGIITYVNDNFCKISKYSQAELLGKNHRIVSSGLHDKAFIKNLWATISKGEIWRNEMINKNKEGANYWIDVTIVPFLNNIGSPVQYVAINKDITEKKLLEQEILSQKIQEQRKISRAIIKAQERERNHMGQELHDNVNQILAGVKLYMSMIGKDKQSKEMIRYPIELIDSAIQEIRSLSSKNVTPLKDVNLKELLQNLLADLDKNSTIKTLFECNIKDHLHDDELKLNIYRIIQEQLNNIMKHAAAKTVSVSALAKDHLVQIIITDDGKGFDTSKKRKGIGISNMINRIESFNGTVVIESSPGNGCKTEINIPY